MVKATSPPSPGVGRNTALARTSASPAWAWWPPLRLPRLRPQRPRRQHHGHRRRGHRHHPRRCRRPQRCRLLGIGNLDRGAVTLSDTTLAAAIVTPFDGPRTSGTIDAQQRHHHSRAGTARYSSPALCLINHYKDSAMKPFCNPAAPPPSDQHLAAAHPVSSPPPSPMSDLSTLAGSCQWRAYRISCIMEPGQCRQLSAFMKKTTQPISMV